MDGSESPCSLLKLEVEDTSIDLSLINCLIKLGFKKSLASTVRKECGDVSARCSYFIYLNRDTRYWQCPLNL